MIRNLRNQRLLAVLGLKDADLTTLHVVHHAALGKPGEATYLIERNRGLFVGIEHSPHLRSHTHYER
ncbi:MAG: hypothetical protein EBT46_00930 [Actinobacteria bacterium]|nr:hypothetical protein [Actinomycetota bacterium]